MGTQSTAAALNSHANFFHFKILPPTCFLSRFCGKGLISPAAIRNKTDILASSVQKNVDTHIPRGMPTALLVAQALHRIELRSAGSGNSAEDDSYDRRHDDGNDR